MIKLTGLWTHFSSTGKEYWSGTIGGAKILIFKNESKKEDNQPDYELLIAEKKKKTENKDESKVVKDFAPDDIPF